MITIASMRGGNWPSQPWHIRVDRSSVLGNPFALNRTCTRSESCAKYEEWFTQQLKLDHPEFMQALDDIVEAYKAHGQVVLYCWCAPKQCHAQTIKEFIEDIINYG